MHASDLRLHGGVRHERRRVAHAVHRQPRAPVAHSDCGEDHLSMSTELTTHLDIPFPPDPNPRKPRMTVPPGSWDTHFHIFGPPNLFPDAESRRYSPPTAPIEHGLSGSSAIGIERGFVVTPSVHDLDPAVTLDAIGRSEGRIRGMIRANANLTASDIKRLHEGGIRGLRFPFAKV